MTTLSPEFVSGFMDFLRWVQNGYESTKDPRERREWGIRGLRALGRMAREVDPAVDREGLLYFLNDLVGSLFGLDHGTADPLLQSRKLNHRRPAPKWALFRGRAAAASALLIRNGATAPEADSWVATRLTKAGYTKPGSRGDTQIRAATIAGWRKAAREGRQGDLMRVEFYSWLDKDGPLEELLCLVAPGYPAILLLDGIKPLANMGARAMLPSVSLMELIFGELPAPGSPEK